MRSICISSFWWGGKNSVTYNLKPLSSPQLLASIINICEDNKLHWFSTSSRNCIQLKFIQDQGEPASYCLSGLPWHWRRDPLRFLRAVLLMVTVNSDCNSRGAPIYKCCSFFAIHCSFLWGLPSWSGSGKLVIFTNQLPWFLFFFIFGYILLVSINKTNIYSLKIFN